MFKNYLKIAFRNISASKSFSFINIVGLATGLATCLLILLYVFDEKSYDQQHDGVDNLYRIATKSGKINEEWAAAAAPVGPGVKQHLPEVEAITRLLSFKDIDNMLLTYGHGDRRKQFFEPHACYADANFFQLFHYRFVYGNAAQALEKPGSVVLSQPVAQKFFGTDNPVGKVITINTLFGDRNYTVGGVVDNALLPSHIPATYFLSMENDDMWHFVKSNSNWTINNLFYTYVKLKPGTQVAAFEQKLQALFKKEAGEELRAAGLVKTLYLQPVKDIHLYSALPNELAPNGNISYLYILGSIAAFILLIACINFMNLTTARSQKRAKEVGVRKVMGAGKSGLIQQFLGESVLMCVLSLLVALVLAAALLPLFNQLTQKQLTLLARPQLLVYITGLTLLTGLAAGIYPAFYLAAFKPIAVLKGRLMNQLSAVMIRKGLVVFQFTVSICLVLAAIVIARQLNYMQNQQLGFQKEQQVILPVQSGNEHVQQNYQAFKNELLKQPAVKAVTAGSTYPGIPNLNDLLFYAEGKSSKEHVDIQLCSVEDNYIPTLGIELLKGRSFSKAFTADSNSIVLNEAAIAKLGYTVDNAVGKTIQYDFKEQHGLLRIVGVVKNYHYESLHNEIKPFGLTANTFGNRYAYVIASLKTTGYHSALDNIGKTWSRIFPGTPFSYSFLDQDFLRNYERETRTSHIVTYFTCIAIIIACLGLFGLATFSAEQRLKEIGVRKVLGASAMSITTLLSKDFIKLVLIAIVIAAPIAWFVMGQWLQNFVYRIQLSWWMFVAAGALAVVIALLTVSFQAIKAAVAAPVKSLRAE
ncbi:putative ABC transport system permease protein [Filimonas lacunae]|uniref:Putative ABC transport system permease protein n=1 Tax=Filimonas lacunae TaxID=477680 RepID=A0A173M9Z2_9BACT|nr:ABC transporter permease [Filimonas lacunae]BAV04342.1 ABC transporter, permease protein [Filimonas lacunae]SIT31075.1 putative ABC transport system permease protein [Filimonas lacunae]